MKKILLSILVLAASTSKAQQSFDFSTNPFTSGWTYYDDYNSSPTPGFEYNATLNRIDYKLSTSVEASFMHTQLNSALRKDYCVSFKITPSNSQNYNTFFPLILTPYQVTGSDVHPWRLNPVNPSLAGSVQNIDFLAIEVYSSQIRFFNKKGNTMTSTSIQSMSPPFYMDVNTSYWVKLEISNGTTAIVKVFQDASLTTEIASTTYTIPELDDMTHLYISNSNGNAYCTHFGSVDDYQINTCSNLGLELVDGIDPNKEVLKIVDLLGRETTFIENTTLIIVYTDGSTKKVFKSNF